MPPTSAVASLTLAVAGLALGALPPGDGDVETASNPPARTAFLVTLEGFTVEYAMIPVPGSDDGTIAPFFAGKTEVPWELYDVFMLRLDLSESQRVAGVDAEARPTKAYGAADRGFGHDGHAALGMSRLSAEKFCDWLGAKTGRTFRLPTEAEWEHLARAGAVESPTGSALDDVAWHAGNSGGRPHPVATKRANAYGLHDVLGNLAEWVATDPLQKKVRVARGGGFDASASETTFEARRVETPAWNKTDPQFPKSKWWLSDASFVGFRVVCEERTDAERLAK